jgi:hypothetical protein
MSNFRGVSNFRRVLMRFLAIFEKKNQLNTRSSLLLFCICSLDEICTDCEVLCAGNHGIYEGDILENQNQSKNNTVCGIL